MGDRGRATVGRSALIYGLTLGRLPLAVLSVVAFLSSERLAAIALLVVFVGLDVLDGVIARGLGLETGLRRALDGTVDKLSVHLVAAFVCLSFEGGAVIWGVLLARDAIQAVAGVVMLRRFHVVAAGAKWHRAYTSAVAFWGALALWTDSANWFVAIPALAIGIIALADYLRQCFIFARGGEVSPASVEIDLLRAVRGVND